MNGDSMAVLALMMGFLYMVSVGVWVRLEDDTRTAIYQAKGRVLAGIGAAAGVLLLLVFAY
jgi:hypothetical protein